ncbi:hypothetical protein FISHEDRAFT_59976 [Fistulina hepatica ATCC 64428]|uniref:Uncharacterized protein n=1 Tax=Fistulina hepatica ATCC 64428 TaxID=1128425 RepID=A0A0D7A9A6_9AGAR|nr:hypothetical protein FISHEDRAFT_59976 [Fistulina hepatica ATCC 64428]
MFALRRTYAFSALGCSMRPSLSPRRRISTSTPADVQPVLSSPKEFKVVLDYETLYIDQRLAEALGWNKETGVEGVPLTLSGWSPSYFAIARTGSESDLLARGTVESSRNPRVKEVLDYLKEC